MSIKAVLFDLDGTLLPMEQDLFLQKYLERISLALSSHGYDPTVLPKSIMKGTYCMIKNDGSHTNEQVFWRCFCDIYGENAINDEPHFDKFYVDHFDSLSKFCGFNPEAARTVHKIKKLGLRTALATNPVFPRIATQKRMSWAGVSPEDFELYTTYENSRFCKPNPLYYSDVASSLGISAEECLMVGNDTTDDMSASQIGMKVFLLTDCLINDKCRDISEYPNGNFDNLIRYVEELI